MWFFTVTVKLWKWSGYIAATLYISSTVIPVYCMCQSNRNLSFFSNPFLPQFLTIERSIARLFESLIALTLKIQNSVYCEDCINLMFQEVFYYYYLAFQACDRTKAAGELIDYISLFFDILLTIKNIFVVFHWRYSYIHIFKNVWSTGPPLCLYCRWNITL